MLLHLQYLFPTQTLHITPDKGIASPQLPCHPPDFSYNFTARDSASDLHEIKDS